MNRITGNDSLAEKLAIKYAADIEKAKQLGNCYPVDLYGRFPWDRSERRGKTTNLSKASLGEFCMAVLSCGGEISSFFVFNRSYVRCAVYIRVQLSIEQKEKIEAETEYRFDPPPVVSVGNPRTTRPSTIDEPEEI